MTNLSPTQRNPIRKHHVYPTAACLLLAGLAAAVALDAQLRGPMRLAWFSALLGLDAVVAMWLTRPPSPRPSPVNQSPDDPSAR